MSLFPRSHTSGNTTPHTIPAQANVTSSKTQRVTPGSSEPPWTHAADIVRLLELIYTGRSITSV